MQNGIFIEPENVRYLDEGGVEQLDGDHIPEKTSISGANYFERGTQVMYLVSSHSHRLTRNGMKFPHAYSGHQRQ